MTSLLPQFGKPWGRQLLSQKTAAITQNYVETHHGMTPIRAPLFPAQLLSKIARERPTPCGNRGLRQANMARERLSAGLGYTASLPQRQVRTKQNLPQR
ncbi:MAG: hypothetical protein WHU94_07375 [Thermogemmata sp.]|jgi:hypothetical protein|uniref:Uncharacterized protein n=1 Tax=Thermogemmata fonticola TaxID=2755323 RepID=A0A7V9ACD2_9BACT|nr:hypothetical protein [Thermogemmata fonticola]MBA2227151.1 hypothetical protein [Thermogemmata fonticola]